MKHTAIALSLLVASSTLVLAGGAEAKNPNRAGENTRIEQVAPSAAFKPVAANKYRPAAIRHGKLTPRQIARILRRHGYHHLQDMRTNGRIYVVKAHGYRGNLVRLTVDAKSGVIKNRKIINRMRPVPPARYQHMATGHRLPFWLR